MKWLVSGKIVHYLQSLAAGRPEVFLILLQYVCRFLYKSGHSLTWLVISGPFRFSECLPSYFTGRSTGAISRSKLKCPLPGCASSVLDLPRHLRLQHRMKGPDARSVMIDRNVAAALDRGQYKRPHKDCPFAACTARIRRVDSHLSGVRTCVPSFQL